jgi:periplasmic protein TonB
MAEQMVRRASELGALSPCMIDDSESLARARRLRGKALALSIAVQTICVAAMLIWPLLAIPGALPPLYVLTPVPPYRGGGRTEKPRLRNRPMRSIQSVLTNRLIFPTPTAVRPVASFEESAPATGASIGIPGNGIGPGPIGDLIPGGSSQGWPLRPPRPHAPARTVNKSEGVMEGALVHRVDPLYPEIARAMHLSGTVRLEAIIGTDGIVQNLEVLSGNPILARAALEAVRQWRYRPTLLNGAPVEVETYITVNFVLAE